MPNRPSSLAVLRSVAVASGIAALVLGSLLLGACAGGSATQAASGPIGTDAPAKADAPIEENDTVPSTTVNPPTAGVRTGSEVLAGEGFSALAGKRVGLIANRVSVVGDTHLIDLLIAAPEVELVAAFAPEHGIRGIADAGELFVDEVDPETGLPIYSLYGANRAPTAEVLADIDILLFDLQDVGTRFYTYISTMGLAMQAAAANGTAFWVLDRPNPLGGTASAGFVRRPELESFVAQYPIPSVHGLTIGELALAIHGERWLADIEDLDLRVIELDGWSRNMRWPETGQRWISPSPGLPSFESALSYAGTVLFEASSISYGTGTRHPFSTVGAPWADPDLLAADLNGRNLPGVEFEPIAYAPRVIEGLATSPKLEGVAVRGVRYVLTDHRVFDPHRTGIHVLDAFRRQAAEKGITDLIDRPDFLDILSGSPALREGLLVGLAPDDIVEQWRSENAEFDALRQPYLLYD